MQKDLASRSHYILTSLLLFPTYFLWKTYPKQNAYNKVIFYNQLITLTRMLEIAELHLPFSSKHLLSKQQTLHQSLRERQKGQSSCLLTWFEILKELETTLNKSPSLFLPLMFSSRNLQCSLFFLSRPSQGVLKLSDLSKMFTSLSLHLVSFNSLLPNKSWQRCVVVYSVTPPFQLSDTCWI